METEKGGRVSRACDFCRLRKFKCDGGDLCQKCHKYGLKCIYTKYVARPRPSNTIINNLSDRVKQLEQELSCYRKRGSLQITSNSEPFAIAEISASPTSTSSVSANANRHYRLRRDGSITSYGPTSMLHELKDDDSITVEPRVDNVAMMEKRKNIQTRLSEGAAAARQLEKFNLLTKSADFDGVPRDLALHLLDVHWNLYHHSFLLTYRPAFMRGLFEEGTYCSKLLMNAIFVASCKVSNHSANAEDALGQRFLNRAKFLLFEGIDEPSISAITALLVMGSSLVSTGQQHLGWLFTGMALRMVTDMSLHLDVEALPPEEIEIRRRLFWGAFVCDRLQSLYLGRPFGIQMRDISVSKEFNDLSEEYEVWTPEGDENKRIVGSPWYSVSCFTCLCKLVEIGSQIVQGFYSLHSFLDIERYNLLHADLLNWKANLPAHLEIREEDFARILPSPNIVTLHLHYYAFSILLHRPFGNWTACTECANQITRITESYRENYTLRRATYQVCYAIYCASSVHIHNAKSNIDAVPLLISCLKSLHEATIPNAGIARVLSILQKLIENAGISSLVEVAMGNSFAFPEMNDIRWDMIDIESLFGIYSDSQIPLQGN